MLESPLKYPEKSDLPPDQLHFLAYIPWDDKYLEFVPTKYQPYFLDVLPQLAVRTTDVHVAHCFKYFDLLISNCETEFHTTLDRDIVALGLILHDIGWSKLSETDIAQSLGVLGLKLNPSALGPKEKHAIEGEIIARQKLREWKIDADKINIICLAVRWHDQPEKVSADGKMVPEVKALVDLDHLWSFTQANFWQDVVRKNVPSKDYVKNLETDLNSYFVTQSGKQLATALLKERAIEVAKSDDPKFN